MSEIVNILGLIGSVLVTISFIPQTYKTLQQKEVSDISYSFMAINIVSSSLMCIYGIYHSYIPVIISDGSVLINCIIILSYIVYIKNKQLSED
jgi:MtN3 and saliva related transmembrane protein